MILYYNFIQKIIDNKITYDDQSEKSKKDRAYKAERAISLMNEYIGFLGGKFYQVCKAYELFEQWFGSLNIVGSYLTWTHHYRIPIDLYENNIIEWSVIELPGTHAKIFVPIRWIVCTEKSIDKLEEKSFLIEDFDNARLTEALLTFDISVEDNIFTPGRVFSRPHIPFECRIFDIVGILEWYGDRQFSQAYIQALKSRFPDIENPERVLTSYLDGEITADSLQSEYGGDLYSIGESIDQRWSYGIERTEIWEVLFFQNNTTLRLSREDIEILRYIALNLNLIRQSILIQLGLTS